MNNLKFMQAMQLEQHCLQPDTHRSGNQSLAALLNKVGYASISEYLEDKQAYLLDQLTFKKLEVDLCNLKDSIQIASTKDTSYFAIEKISKLTILAVDDTCYNNNLEHDLQPVVIHHPAFNSCILLQPNDLFLAISLPESKLCDMYYFLKKLKSILEAFNLGKITIHRNDILIDDKKVCGAANYIVNGQFITGAFISFNSDPELIKSMCTKQSVKEPGYIPICYQNQFVEELEKWLS